MTDARRCCFTYTDADGAPARTCERAAEYEVHTVRDAVGDTLAGPDPYSDQTDACTAHVGALLGFQPDAPRPAEIYWHVRWIGKPVEIANG